MAAQVNGRKNIKAWEQIPGFLSLERKSPKSLYYQIDPLKLDQEKCHIFFPVSFQSLSQQIFVTTLESRHFSPREGIENPFVMKTIELTNFVFICWVQFPAADIEKCHALAYEFKMNCNSAHIKFEIPPHLF